MMLYLAFSRLLRFTALYCAFSCFFPLILLYCAISRLLRFTLLYPAFSRLLRFTPLSPAYRALSCLPRFTLLSLAYHALACFLLLITLYPLSPVYSALHCFLSLTAFYRAFCRLIALYPDVKLICFILFYANPFAFSPPYAKLPYNFCLVIFFLYLSLRVLPLKYSPASLLPFITFTLPLNLFTLARPFHNFSLSPNFAKPFYFSSLYVILFYFSSLFVNSFYVFPCYSPFPLPAPLIRGFLSR
jgi:hypothetical protein